MPRHEHRTWLISYDLDFCLCLLQVLEKFTSRLVQSRVMAHKDLRTLSKYQLILARDQFRKNPPQHIKAQKLHIYFFLLIIQAICYHELVKGFYWLHQVFTLRPFEAFRLLILAALIDILELEFFFNAAYLLLLQLQLLDLSQCLAVSLLKLECQTFLF